MGDWTIYSGDTVIQGYIHQVLQTSLSLNLFVTSSDDRPDNLLFEAGKHVLQRC